ncbi:mucin-6-like isoform X2 [Zerene cesonia]|uniref:mucin-6-like isoform X2 n=1 Tax=Zerene cesonia TaxID=33412 RepID=UPI0018E52CC6|nr:mucin-6-like isoform X2 [Zerene cesonia]
MIAFLVLFVYCASFTFVSTVSPICGSNEVNVECRQICPPQSCNISYTEYACDPPPACEPGCNCIDNYLRDGNGICIKNDDCPPPLPDCGENATPSVCTKQCPPQTCESLLIVTKKPCIPGPCRRGCNCKDGYLKNSDGECILKELCPKSQDDTSVNEQQSDCKSVGGSYSSSSSYTSVTNSHSSSNTTGTYVDNTSPKNESTNKCQQNETYVFCNAGCPSNYCPSDDRRGIIACSPPQPCPPGCACQANYKRVSVEDNRCILASECPPVNCTRSNEVWYPCPPPCFSDSCRDIGVQRECYRSGCQPQCACDEGYYRNDSGDCVLQENCPKYVPTA